MKKFILKPGNHQFIPGSHPIHNNENLDDEEAEWYLKRFPHIANLFERIPDDEALREIRLNREMKLVGLSGDFQSSLERGGQNTSSPGKESIQSDL